MILEVQKNNVLFYVIMGVLLGFSIAHLLYNNRILQLEAQITESKYKSLEEFTNTKDKLTDELMKTTEKFNKDLSASSAELDALKRRISSTKLVTIDGCKPSDDFIKLWNSLKQPR